MTGSERIEHLIKSRNITKKVFAEMVNMKADTLSKMFSNKSDPKLPLLKSCLIQFPELNARWLILGDGQMWQEDRKAVIGKKGDNEELKKKVNELESDFKELRTDFQQLKVLLKL